MPGAPGGKTTPTGSKPAPPAPVPAAPAEIERITVALVPKAAADLQHLLEATGLSKTDLVNRAVSLYDFINTQLREGRDLLIRDSETKETQVVRLM